MVTTTYSLPVTASFAEKVFEKISDLVHHRRMMRFPIAFGSLNFVPLGKSM